MKKHLLLIAIVLMFALALTACASNAPAPAPAATPEPAPAATPAPTPVKPSLLSWSTGTTSGSMYPVGVVMAQVINDADPRFNITIEVSAGAVENARNIDSKASDIGFISRITAIDAYNGQNNFDAPLDFKMVMNVYNQTMHLVVLDDSPIQSFKDYVGRRVVVGPAGSANLIENLYAMQALGYTSDDFKCLYISVADGIEALMDGDADAMMFVGGDPVSGLLDLGARTKFRFISFTPEEINTIVNSEPFGFTAAPIPPNTYEGIDYEVSTVSVDMLIGVRSDLEDDVVYNFISDILNPEFTTKMAAGHGACKQIFADSSYPVNIPIPLHPGAVRYFEEHNLTK